MKFILCFLLSIAVVSSSIAPAYAQNVPRIPFSSPTISQIRLGQELVSLEQFKVVVDEVTYSLQNLDAVIKNLENEQADIALEGISRNVAIDIKERFEAGLTLLAILVNDETLDFDDRLEKAAALHGALASLTFRILRDRYADKKNADELRESRSLPEFLADLAIGSVREISYDARAFTTRSAEKEVLWAPLERGRREELGKQIIGLYQTFAAQYLPVPNEPHAAEMIRMNFLKHTQKMMLQIKQSRWHSQVAVTGLYAALTYIALAHPFVDMFGIVEGGRSENSLIASSAIYFTFWATVTVTKGLTITGKSVGMLKDLRRLLEDPSAKVDKPGLFDRFKTRLWNLEGEKKPIKENSFFGRACKAFGKPR